MSEAESKPDSRWIPLEANPEIMNSWAKKLGLATHVCQFGDIYGLDAELLAMVPQPVQALLLIFPLNGRIADARKEADEKIKREGQPALDPTIIFIEQTIRNACGTIGLLHALTNSSATIDPLSPLSKFVEQVAPLTPAQRAKVLEETTLFSTAHVAAASLGQTPVPTDLDTDLHFVTFVQAPSAETAGQKRLIELDGNRAAPVDHGPSENLLNDAAKVVREKFISFSTSQNFGLISLGPPA